MSVRLPFQMQRTSVLQASTTAPIILNDQGDGASSIGIVFRKMLFFILLMAIAPLASFFIAKDYIIEGIFQVSNRNSYTYAAVVAVIVVHIVLITFLIVAFRENIPGDKKRNDATSKKD
jgi:NADH:ubiquinone oxidoreductase subunit 5 (subunit L)/multisubunit Na+/H+ antiporter MnhA subunit